MRNGWCDKAFGSLCRAWVLLVVALLAVWGGWRFGKSRGCFVPVAVIETTKDADTNPKRERGFVDESSLALRVGVAKTDDAPRAKNEPAVPGQPPRFAAFSDAAELEPETSGPGPRVPHRLWLPPECDPALVGLANFEPAIVQDLVRLAGYDDLVEGVDRDGKKRPPPVIDLDALQPDMGRLSPDPPDPSPTLPAARAQAPLCIPPSRLPFLGDPDLDRLVRAATPAAHDLENVRKNVAGVGAPINTLQDIEGRSRVAAFKGLMLRVVIAEVNRGAAERLGASLPSPEQGLCLDGGAATYTLSVMRHSPCARVLAETNVIALDCHAARLAAAGNTIATSCGFCRAQMPYAVHMELVPTILGDGRVRLEVSASINDKRKRSGTDDPNVDAFALTVEMSSGETLALAAPARTPTSCWLLPFLRCKPAEQELVIMITPDIAMPGERLHQ